MTMMQEYHSTIPANSEYAQYYASYIARVPAGDIVETLARQRGDSARLFGGIDDDKASFRYQPDKWTIRDVLGHMIDAERIFCYRALCIARGDKTPLPGFDENDYVANGDFNTRGISDLAGEFEHVRTVSLDLFRSCSEEAWRRTGVANSFEISVRAIAWIIAGHELHHIAILQTKYLLK